ncbi:glycosyltransferase family 4 protein [Sphingomonadaceae bacterium jetA1]|jgi:glycosyltransferase involved in cell wall biosynthesis|uniref:glycosyltransferase family 4 protein n=1 Tax=Facivitalis istanbulensis TaxID=3075838 RepID=UPI00347A9F0C
MAEQQPKTILILAYSISPTRGSEYAVGWNHVVHMAQHHRLIVLYGLAGDHMGDFEEMTGVDTSDFRYPVEFVPVMPSKAARIANHLNRTSVLPYSFYVAYRYWHLEALKVARGILNRKSVDIVHYLCPIGYREPGYLWKLDRPYIWGPIGAMDLRPLRAFFGLGLSEGLKTLARNTVNALQFRVNPRLARALANTDILVTNTVENATIVRKVYGKESIIMPENGVTTPPTTTHTPPSDGPLRLIWAGTIETRKALVILLRALADVPDQWALDVVGSGPLAEPMQALARELGINDRIRWHGKIPRKDVFAIFAQAHLHVLTSQAEAHTTVLFEAMGMGVPTVAFDHCGMHDSICDKCGVRIMPGSVSEMTQRLTAILSSYIADRSDLAVLSQGALACAEQASWQQRTLRWNAIYDRVIETWKRKP